MGCARCGGPDGWAGVAAAAGSSTATPCPPPPPSPRLAYRAPQRCASSKAVINSSPGFMPIMRRALQPPGKQVVECG